MQTIQERIGFLIKLSGLRREDFEKVMELGKGSLNNILSRGSLPGFEVIQKISKKFDALSLDWLIKGEGDMFKSGAGPDKLNAKAKALLEAIQRTESAHKEASAKEDAEIEAIRRKIKADEDRVKNRDKRI